MATRRVEFTTGSGFVHAVRSLNEHGIKGAVFGKSFFREKKVFIVDIPEEEIEKLKHDFWWQENFAA